MKRSDYNTLTASLEKLHKQMIRTVTVMAKAVDDEQHPNVIQLAGAAGMVKEWIADIKDEYERYAHMIEP